MMTARSFPMMYDPPPPRYASYLRDKREEIILTSLRGGHTYDAALTFAKQHIPDDQLERVVKSDDEKMAAWQARYDERREAESKRRSWWDFFGLFA